MAKVRNMKSTKARDAVTAVAFLGVVFAGFQNTPGLKGSANPSGDANKIVNSNKSSSSKSDKKDGTNTLDDLNKKLASITKDAANSVDQASKNAIGAVAGGASLAGDLLDKIASGDTLKANGLNALAEAVVPGKLATSPTLSDALKPVDTSKDKDKGSSSAVLPPLSSSAIDNGGDSSGSISGGTSSGGVIVDPGGDGSGTPSDGSSSGSSSSGGSSSGGSSSGGSSSGGSSSGGSSSGSSSSGGSSSGGSSSGSSSGGSSSGSESNGSSSGSESGGSSSSEDNGIITEFDKTGEYNVSVNYVDNHGQTVIGRFKIYGIKGDKINILQYIITHMPDGYDTDENATQDTSVYMDPDGNLHTQYHVKSVPKEDGTIVEFDKTGDYDTTINYIDETGNKTSVNIQVHGIEGDTINIMQYINTHLPSGLEIDSSLSQDTTVHIDKDGKLSVNYNVKTVSQSSSSTTSDGSSSTDSSTNNSSSTDSSTNSSGTTSAGTTNDGSSDNTSSVNVSTVVQGTTTSTNVNVK